MSQPNSSWQWVWKVGSVKTGVRSWTRWCSDGIMTHMRGTSFPVRSNVAHRIGSPLFFSHPAAAARLFTCSEELAKVQQGNQENHEAYRHARSRLGQRRQRPLCAPVQPHHVQ